MKLLIYQEPAIVLQEVPDEISLAFTIVGCPLRCKGCHSKHLWGVSDGIILTRDLLLKHLDKYEGRASCVLFLGGDQYKTHLVEALELCRYYGYKTALYTGYPDVHNDIKKNLTYLKTGHYVEKLGGLDSPKTNQKFINVVTGEILNYKFWRK